MRYRTMDAFYPVDREDGVAIGISDQQRSRCNHGGEGAEVPAVAVVHEHAVAVAIDASIDNMVLEVCDPRNRDGHLDSWIERCGIPTIGASTAPSGDSDPLWVDFGSPLQIIDGSDRIPSFDSRRCIASGHPVPALVLVEPMMDALDLPKLNRIDRHADVAMLGEPERVVLIMSLVPQADSIRLHLSMAADVENGRQWGLHPFGAIEVGGDPESRLRLEGQPFNDHLIDFEMSLVYWGQWRFLGPGIEPQHRLQLA